MPYEAHIDRKNPACFVFLVDQSGSMGEQCIGAEAGVSKAQALASRINSVLAEIVIKCSNDTIRDYFHVAVIGYGDGTYSRFNGLVPVSGMDRLARVEEQVDPVTGDRFKARCWLDPVAVGHTPMCAALSDAHKLVAEWARTHPASFPSIVFNFTDGQSTDGDPAEIAQQLRAVSGNDGRALLFNGHLSSLDSGVIEYPVTVADLPKDDPHALMLFGMSSVIPDSMRVLAQRPGGFQIKPGGRGMVFNGDYAAVLNLLDMGTRTQLDSA